MLAARRRWRWLVLTSLWSLLTEINRLHKRCVRMIKSSFSRSSCRLCANDRELVRSPYSGASMQQHFMTASHPECACLWLHSVAATVTSWTRCCRLGASDIRAQLPFHLRWHKLLLMSDIIIRLTLKENQ